TSSAATGPHRASVGSGLVRVDELRHRVDVVVDAPEALKGGIERIVWLSEFLRPARGELKLSDVLVPGADADDLVSLRVPVAISALLGGESLTERRPDVTQRVVLHDSSAPGSLRR